jgi:uncharacterized damage-inducible protein DinB
VSVYEGWEGYQTALVRAVATLTAEQLAFRPAPGMRSVGETARHIAAGRLTWFRRMDAPGSAELDALVPEWVTDREGNRHVVEERLAPADDAAALVGWLERTWGMVAATLAAWTTDDLQRTYRHTFRGTTYAVSYQWTIWRILSHDMHHGGQLTTLLYQQGVEPAELGWLGGHLTEPPVAD